MSNESREFSMVRELAKIACLRKISMCISMVREQSQTACLMKVSTCIFYG